MPDRDDILRIIDEAYETRARGDKAGLAKYWAPAATYRMAGAANLLPTVPVGPHEANAAVDALIDLFQFHDLERLHAVVEDDRAAIHWRVTVSTGGQEPVKTELYDLWTFDTAGKLKSLVQFTDTALLRTMLE
jgi:ketosteroid isomerase-like protein